MKTCPKCGEKFSLNADGISFWECGSAEYPKEVFIASTACELREGMRDAGLIVDDFESIKNRCIFMFMRFAKEGMDATQIGKAMRESIEAEKKGKE